MNASTFYNNFMEQNAPGMSSGYNLLGSSSNPLCQKIAGNFGNFCDLSSYSHQAAQLPQDWDVLLQLPSDVDQQLELLCEGLPAVPAMPDVTSGNLEDKAGLMGLHSAQKALSCVPAAPRTSATGSDMSDNATWEVGKQTLKLEAAVDTKVSDQDNISDFDSCSHKYDSSNEEDQDLDEGSLSKEPWFRTLKSAGVRIKGRTKQELIEVAERIRKRRRESAARSRSRRINKVSTIADQNKALRQENEELKRLIEQIQNRQASETWGGQLLQVEQSAISF